MSQRRWLAIVSAAVVIAGAVWWNNDDGPWVATREKGGGGGTSRQMPDTIVQASADSADSEAAIRNKDIAFFERRVAEDTMGAADRSLLAGLYMERARATAGYNDYERAESLARQSLALRTEHNSQTFGLLASALLARHAFAEALAVARRADSLDPGIPAHIALLGEVELETGDYESANRHFSSLRFGPAEFTIAARVARWNELTGHLDTARQMLRGAIRKVQHRDDLPREQVSWFFYRLGELELRSGALDSADATFRRGLAVYPGDYRILGALARLASARGRWQEAVDYGSQAIAIQLDPATLGTLSDAYAALGDTAQSGQYARAMTVNALRQPGPIHRAWGLFLLDHGNAADVRQVLARTRVEMRTRHDVYGYDLLAWGLHKQGRQAEAQAAIARALSQRTEDAQLFYHAGMIERALGDSVDARNHLQRAMLLNPRFSATQAPLARATLDSLEGHSNPLVGGR